MEINKKEEWRPVVGYERFYMVSNLGRVKSVGYGRERILKPWPDDDGYLKIHLYKNKMTDTFRVHRLVMEAFVGKCPKGYEVDHIDFNPSNNCLYNLRYIQSRKNAGRHGDNWRKNNAEAAKRRSKENNDEANNQWLQNTTVANKERCSKTVFQYSIEKKQLIKVWASAAEIKRELGCNPSYISKCCLGKKLHAYGFFWSHHELSNQELQDLKEKYEMLDTNAEASRKKTSKSVDQYTIDGTFVKRWPSIKEIVRQCHYNNALISQCCNEKTNTAYGYVWVFSGTKPDFNKIKNRSGISKPVNQYTLDGEFVKTWSSAAEIERVLGVNNRHVSECCRNIRKTAGKRIWRFA